MIGAGPLGLAAAAHLLERGLEPLVLESGAGPASAVAEWGHVRLFSAWPELVDPAAVRLLGADGLDRAGDGLPDRRGVDRRLPRAAGQALGDRVRYDARVVGVSRRGRDRLVDAGRAEQPFTVHVVDADGNESRVEARAVIDASGTWRQPNPAGADGYPAARGTRRRGGRRSPTGRRPGRGDDAGGAAPSSSGQRHSAFNAIDELVAIAADHPGTRITWVLRRVAVGDASVVAPPTSCPQRGALGQRAKQAVESGAVELVTGFRTAQIRREASRRGAGGRGRPARCRRRHGRGADRVPAGPVLPVRDAAGPGPDPGGPGAVRAGDRPEHPLLRLRARHGAADLAQPEPDLYLVGMKSYGRAPTFLALTGYEQVRSVVAELAGDHEAAARVELTFPDTGVCGGAGLFDDPAAGGAAAAAAGRRRPSRRSSS